MEISKTYKFILDSMPAELPAKVLAVLIEFVGARDEMGVRKTATRRVLAERTMGRYTDSTDRMVRLAIETLRKEHRLPVLAVSGTAGYWLAESDAEIHQAVEELRKRHDQLGETVRSLATMRVPAAPPVLASKPVQGRLL